MKKLLSAAVVLASVASLSSCFPSGEVKVDDTEFDQIVEKAEQIENFSLNFDIPLNVPDSVPTLYTSLKTWNMLDIDSAFGIDGLKEHLEYNSNHFPEEKRYVDISASGLLGYDFGDIMYDIYFDDKKDKDVPREFACTYAALNSFDFTDYDKELSHFPKAEALSKAEELLHSLGITEIGKPTVYPITREYAAAAAECTVDELGWNDSDEVYYIVYPVSFGGIELLQEDINILAADYYSQTASRISIIMSADELISFQCMLYSDSISFSEEVEKIISPTEAAGILTDHYAGAANTSKRDFNSLRLVYVPTDTNGTGFVYEPAWLFEGTDSSVYDGEEYKGKFYELIYAKTGVRYANYG